MPKAKQVINQNWQLDFVYREGETVCDVHLTGNQAAISLGLNLAATAIKPKLQARLQQSKAPSSGFIADVITLQGLINGEALAPYEGKFLTIKEAGEGTGFTNWSIEWSD